MKNYLLILWLVSATCFAQKTTLYGIGDSTMANKQNPDRNPEFGWMQVLQPFFKDNIKVENKAVNGRSTKSFINEKRWDSVYKKLQKGDYVFIEFGHNDEKINDSTRFTNPHTSYRYNLIKFVKESREKGAIPVLLSSIARRDFNEKGVLVPSHVEYTLETRLVAQEYKVPFIDLEYYTELMELKYGPERSKELHLHFKKGEEPYYTEDKADDTHLSKKGATEVAQIVINQIKLLEDSSVSVLKKSIK
ncbi:rhamnogalacturonan acetylesterase [Flavobacterium sp. Fl-77]|uniref:Rhamnogalacturonan acetylesterase n=1 Tax=Flavobacterium flavipigmentatum TaxID=2893884 RepID=A0AAJ2VYG4_9FLAO|nr:MULTISPECIES: rhamnogalacturonan acetylesterase [unclassified Flavobacterium]MDX6183631.1 rhamnogalacturonan acetylesterase [Flavobacterium sp. Fl-33]MDX6187183.1 rhamnogalacturonan acetylesterase [Flavobacterium sp. Fl-77]UFH38006.1 rhamnogalacturonan acetylesterase [Flavobacterium sp. F-70]